MSHGLFYRCPFYVSGPGNISVALLSMQGQRALGFHQKNLNLCSEDERRSYGFRLLKMYFKLEYFTMLLYFWSNKCSLGEQNNINPNFWMVVYMWFSAFFLSFCLFIRHILAQCWCQWILTESWRFTPNRTWSATEESISMRSPLTCEC